MITSFRYWPIILVSLLTFNVFYTPLDARYCQAAEPPILNRPRQLGNNDGFLEEIKKTHHKVVIIYLANDRMDRVHQEGAGNYGYLTQSLQSEIQTAKEENQNVRLLKLQRALKALQADSVAFRSAVKQDIVSLKKAISFPWPNGGVNRTELVLVSNSANDETWGCNEPGYGYPTRFYYTRWRTGEEVELAHAVALYKPIPPDITQPLTKNKLVMDLLTDIISYYTENVPRPRFILVVRDRNMHNRFLAPMCLTDLSKITTPKLLGLLVTRCCDSSRDDGRLVESIMVEIEKLGSKYFEKWLNKQVENTDGPLRGSTIRFNKIKIATIGTTKSDFILDVDKIARSNKAAFPIIAYLGSKSSLESGDLSNQTLVSLDILKNSKGNDFIPGRSISKQKIASYTGVQSKHLGVLVTTNGTKADHRYIDFSRLVNPKLPYRKKVDLQDAMLQLFIDSAKAQTPKKPPQKQ